MTTSYPERRVPPRATMAAPSPPAAPAPGRSATSSPYWRRYRSATESKRVASSTIWASVAPFCRAKRDTASKNPTWTSQAPTSSTVPSPPAPSTAGAPEPPVGGGRAAQADDHPERVGTGSRRLEGTGQRPRRVGRCRVSAATASLPAAPPARTRPEARAISTIATGPARNHSATTGAPSGPDTSALSS